MNKLAIKDLLERQLDLYYTVDFINTDPISLPHYFSRKQDIEIIAFWIAMLSWGKRSIIINKGRELIRLMDYEPYEFIMNHTEEDLKALAHFKHRTFQPTDTQHFITFLKHHYTRHNSLESAFLNKGSVKDRLIYFHKYFFSLPHSPRRTQKHVSTPAKNSACKRLNMFLRWMVRNDDKGIDFGLWKTFDQSELMIPLDIHVVRVARKHGLLKRKSNDWKAVELLTHELRAFDASDPVKYDYALFSMGLNS